MRVLLTTESFLPYLSGVTVSVDALARGLGLRGHEVLVLGPRPADGEAPEPVGSPGPAPAYAWLPSYQLPRIAPPQYRMPLPLPWTGAMRTATAFRADVVHAHSPFVTGLLARRVARASGAPLVFTHHTRFADYHHYLGPLAGPGSIATDAYLQRFWMACAAIVAPSGDLADEIRAQLPDARRHRVHVVPTGIDVAGIRALTPVDPRIELGWEPDSIVAASLGRLAREKSPLTLLDAIAVAATRHPRLRLLVIGAGAAEAEVRARIARPDLAGRVALVGALPRTEALARLRGCDLFVFTSRTETQGLVLAEAITCGLPAVAVAGPGVADSVRHEIDGIVVDAMPEAERVARLAEAISSLVAEPARRAGLAARAAADADRFAIEGRVEEIETVYRAAGA